MTAPAQTPGPAAAPTPAGPAPDPTRAWARERAQRLRRQLGDLVVDETPLYGSRDWHRLPDNDPRRWLAALAAAEAWRADSDPHRLAARLDLEVEAQRRADERDHDSWRQVAAKVRHLAVTPSHDELQRRRAQPSAHYRGTATA